MDTEPLPERDSTWTFYIVLFSLFVLLALWANLSNLRHDASGKQVPDRWDSLLQGDANARLALALPLISVDPVEEAQRAAEYYSKALPWPAAYRRLGITKQVLLGKNGLAELEGVAGREATKGLRKSQILKLRSEADVWRAIYGPVPLTSSQVREFIPRVRRLNLGPLKEPAVAEVYARAGMAAEADAVMNRARNAAAIRFAFALFILLLGIVATVAGVSLLVNFLVRNSLLLKQAAPLTLPSGAVFGGFTAYLICVALFGAAGGAVGKGSASRIISEIALNTAAFFVGFEILRRLARGAGWDLCEIGLRGMGWSRAIKWGVGGYSAALPLMLIALGIAYLLQNTVLRNVPTPQHPIVIDLAGGGLTTVLAYVLAVIVAPVIEETFFRGAVYTGLRARMGVWGAALFCAVMFASIHPTLPLGFLPILALSLALAVLREKTGSLYPGMICHALNNAVMLTLAVLVY